VARPIAKRRAGLLGRVAPPNVGIHSCFSHLVAVQCDSISTTPSSPGLSQRQRTGVSALHRPILRALHQCTVYWVTVNIKARAIAPAANCRSLPFGCAQGRDDNLWVGRRGIPPLAENARSGPPGCHKSKSKAAGEGARATQALAAFFTSSNWVISTRKGGAAAALFDGVRRWCPKIVPETPDWGRDLLGGLLGNDFVRG
jgi:hypothetical protein